jgi:DNA-binding NarL/FixJ family response regulator
MPVKQILIADDHPAIRSGVKQILSDEYSDIEFGEASNGVETLKKIKEKKWDLLILDIDMPGRNGLEVMDQLKEESSKVPVIIFSMHPEEQMAVRAFKTGAAGYLSKNTLDSELVKAVQQVFNGRKYITPTAADLLVAQMENPHDKPLHENLSNREYETFLLLAKGEKISDIAQALSLSAASISTFRSRILEKMGMKKNADIISYAIKNKLV